MLVFFFSTNRKEIWRVQKTQATEISSADQCLLRLLFRLIGLGKLICWHDTSQLVTEDPFCHSKLAVCPCSWVRAVAFVLSIQISWLPGNTWINVSLWVSVFFGRSYICCPSLAPIWTVRYHLPGRQLCTTTYWTGRQIQIKHFHLVHSIWLDLYEQH